VSQAPEIVTRKIHTLGGSGSGKTSAGVVLYSRFGLPHLNLNEIFWERQAPTFGIKADPQLRDAALYVTAGPRG